MAIFYLSEKKMIQVEHRMFLKINDENVNFFIDSTIFVSILLKYVNYM